MALAPWDAAAQVVRIERAEFVVWSGPEPPPAHAPWRPVRLPHRWSGEEYRRGHEGWYRLSLTLEHPPEELWGLYLPVFNMNAALYLNGHDLGASGRFEPPISRNWNRPLYRPAPAPLWRAGENRILVRLATYPMDGNLGPLLAGPAAELEPRYERQRFFQLEISEALFPITLAVGLFALGLWWGGRHNTPPPLFCSPVFFLFVFSLPPLPPPPPPPPDTLYLWFGASVLCWSVFSINMFIENPPLGPKAWEWLAQASLDWWVVLFVIFCLRFTGLRRRRLERALLGFGVVASLGYAIVPLEGMMAASRLFHGISLVIGLVAVTMVTVAARRRRSRRLLALAAGLAVLLLLGIHDWVLQFKILGAAGTTGFHLHHYFSPLVFVAIGAHLSGRFVTALNEAERLNRELERRIAAARAEIEEHYRTIEAMERQRALAQERERLSREIHDGIGGAISNAIMLADLVAQRTGWREAERLRHQRDLLEGALSEMRSLIFTLEEEALCVRDVAGHIHERCARRLAPLGIAYEGRIELPPPPLPLTRQQSLALLRIFQEGLNNIVKHAGARRVEWRVTATGAAVRFCLSDDGAGFDPRHTGQGHGLRNMARRAREIGARLSIDARPGGGTRLTVEIDRPPAEGSLPAA